MSDETVWTTRFYAFELWSVLRREAEVAHLVELHRSVDEDGNDMIDARSDDRDLLKYMLERYGEAPPDEADDLVYEYPLLWSGEETSFFLRDGETVLPPSAEDEEGDE